MKLTTHTQREQSRSFAIRASLATPAGASVRRRSRGRRALGSRRRIPALTLANGRSDDIHQLGRALLHSLRKARASQRILRGCVRQSELPPFLN